MTNAEVSRRFFVMWNGRIPPPRLPTVPPPMPQPWVREHWGTSAADYGAIADAVSACLVHRACTMQQIQQVTGFSHRQIASAIQRLRRQRRLLVAPRRLGKLAVYQVKRPVAA